MTALSQYVDNVIAAFVRAAEINRRAPGRDGATISLSPDIAYDVMVTGDLHGHRRHFHQIQKIADLEGNPHRHLVLQEVCHGNSVYESNGGCMSHAVLEDIALLVTRYPGRVHLILGNHELAEMTDFPIRKNNLLLNLLFRLGLQQMYGASAEKVRAAAMRFLWSCPLAMRLPQGIFVSHSLPDAVDRRGFDRSVFHRELTPSDGVEDCDVFRLVWGRDYRRENANAFCQLIGARVLITGHEPCREGFVAPNDVQVILDCCGDNAAYVILPVGPAHSLGEIMSRVEVMSE